MVSKTKFAVDTHTLQALFAAAGIENAQDIAPLGAGEYNAVFSARADGREYVIKIAPAQGTPIMTLEKGLIESEVFWYRQMREHTTIRVPEVYYTDFSCRLIPAGYFIMERLGGEQLDKMQLTKPERAEAEAAKAQMAAQLHAIKNGRFGYIQNGLHDSWYLALHSMLQNVLQDAARKNQKSKRGERLLAHVEQYRSILEQAEGSMVNFDIWDPNILCTRENGTLQYAWIDPERSFWGDAVADFVCLDMMTPLAEKKAALQAYNAMAKTPVTATHGEAVRHAVMMGYLAAIMEVEKYYRYTPRHFGWWRNVLVSNLLYKRAFAVLQKG